MAFDEVSFAVWLVERAAMDPRDIRAPRSEDVDLGPEEADAWTTDREAPGQCVWMVGRHGWRASAVFIRNPPPRSGRRLVHNDAVEQLLHPPTQSDTKPASDRYPSISDEPK